MGDKQELYKWLKDNEFVNISGKFTGQVVLTLNINQGGVTDVKRVVEDRIR